MTTLLPGRNVPGTYGGGHGSIELQLRAALRSILLTGFSPTRLSKHSKCIPESQDTRGMVSRHNNIPYDSSDKHCTVLHGVPSYIIVAIHFYKILAARPQARRLTNSLKHSNQNGVFFKKSFSKKFFLLIMTRLLRPATHH